ncbi:MAG TPA: ATPase, partial [Kribbella sp.]
MTETTVPAGTVAQQSRLIGEAVGEVKRVIVGQEHMVETLMV